MKAFVSWSGGKDCMLALHRFLKDPGNEVVSLVNMCDELSGQSRSHGLSRELIACQAACMGLPIVQQPTSSAHYEANFKQVISELKARGATAGVFGDIYLMEHRTWIERVCSESGIAAVFPLWENNTSLLLQEFISEGFKALTVSIHTGHLPVTWLGRRLDAVFLNDIINLPGIDPCAENGEYHSFVYDGPLFQQPVSFREGEISEHSHHYFLRISLS